MSAIALADPGRPTQIAYLKSGLDTQGIRDALEELSWEEDDAGGGEIRIAGSGSNLAVGFLSEGIIVVGPSHRVDDALSVDKTASFHSRDEILDASDVTSGLLTLEVDAPCPEFDPCTARSISYSAGESGGLDRMDIYVFANESRAADAEDSVAEHLRANEALSGVAVEQLGSVLGGSGGVGCPKGRPTWPNSERGQGVQHQDS